MLHVASLASEDGASTERRVARRLRAVVLGPRGGALPRRRASDAFRLGFAIAVVVSIPLMRANSAAELGVVHALNPPPTAIRWLVTSVFWLGIPGWPAVRWPRP